MSIAIVLVITLIITLTGCDHTDLDGEIYPSPLIMTVGETVSLTLEVPDELDEIYRECWTVEPDSLGTIEYDDSQEKNREVTFTAANAGTGLIEVWGFYKQTNPQFITEVNVRVE